MRTRWLMLSFVWIAVSIAARSVAAPAPHSGAEGSEPAADHPAGTRASLAPQALAAPLDPAAPRLDGAPPDPAASAGAGPPILVADGMGGAIVVWFSDDPSGLRAQRLDSEGRRLWGQRGVPVQPEEALPASALRAAADGAGGVILVWVEPPEGLRAQRLSASGAPVWERNGIVLGAAPSSGASRLVLTIGAGGDPTVAWTSRDAGGELVRLARKIHADGSQDSVAVAPSEGVAGDSPDGEREEASPFEAGLADDEEQAAQVARLDPVTGVPTGLSGPLSSVPDGFAGVLSMGRGEGGRIAVRRTDPSGTALWTVWAASITTSVDVMNFSFHPASVSIATGDTVKWVWKGGSHSTTSGSCSGGCAGNGGWNSGVRSSGSFSHVFNLPGTFNYFCSVHGSMMQGSVTASGEPNPFTCDATAVPQSGEDQLTVRFSATLNGVAPFTTNWEFGDSASSAEAAPTHVYTQDGLFTASLHAVDGMNRDCSRFMDIIVTTCEGRTLTSLKVKQKRQGALVILTVLGAGFKKGDVVQIDSGSGFVDVPLTKVKPSKLTAKGVQGLFPAGSTVQVRVRKPNQCASSSLPASR